jgi:hypothetical protein
MIDDDTLGYPTQVGRYSHLRRCPAAPQGLPVFGKQSTVNFLLQILVLIATDRSIEPGEAAPDPGCDPLAEAIDELPPDLGVAPDGTQFQKLTRTSF